MLINMKQYDFTKVQGEGIDYYAVLYLVSKT